MIFVHIDVGMFIYLPFKSGLLNSIQHKFIIYFVFKWEFLFDLKEKY